MQRRGFTQADLVIIGVLGAIGVAATLFVKTHQDTVANRVDCARNLRQIGQAMLLYSNDNKGSYPRVRWSGQGGKDPNLMPVFGTGAAAKEPFGPDGPQANDVTAAVFLLLRTQDIRADRFICPSSRTAQVERYDGLTPLSRSNFTDYRNNLSYSYANCYPSAAAVKNGWKWNNTVGAEFAVVADVNPGVEGDGSNVLSISANVPASQLRQANSLNHFRYGQNVLWGDGHVTFEPSPFCGVNKDNIYTSGDGKLNAPPIAYGDSVLLPSDD